MELAYLAEGQQTPRHDAVQYQVKFEGLDVLDAQSILGYLNDVTLSQPAERASMIQMLNIFFKHQSKVSNDLIALGPSKLFSVGPNAEKAHLGAGIEALKGFFSSVRLATQRILVNVQVTQGAFYKPLCVDKLMQERKSQLNAAWAGVERFLRGLRVRRLYLKTAKENQATRYWHGKEIVAAKKIAGLARKSPDDPAPRSPRVPHNYAGAAQVEFWFDNSDNTIPGQPSGYITVQDYFLKRKCSPSFLHSGLTSV